jgi:hypothetical protein
VRETNEGNAAEIDEGVEAPATGLDETPDANIVNDINTSFQSDIFDPRIWDKLRSLDDKSLMAGCVNMEDALKSKEHKDIDGTELFGELILIQDLLKKSMGPLDILKFPNAIIAYRILLTISVTVASAERSFSKLKLLKSYMRSTMTQERLNGLAMISIESDVFEDTDYEGVIKDFISRNRRRMLLFSRT